MEAALLWTGALLALGALSIVGWKLYTILREIRQQQHRFRIQLACQATLLTRVAREVGLPLHSPPEDPS